MMIDSPQRWQHPRQIALAVCAALLFSVSTAQAFWHDNACLLRRPITVEWNAEQPAGDEVATVEFLTAGRIRDNGEDVRVYGANGRLMPSRVLAVGPGDQARVVFSLYKGEKNYFVYFGAKEAHAEAPPALVPKQGLLMEVHQWTGGAIGNFKQLEQSWDRSKTVVGAIMVDRPFVGANPFGEQRQLISKLTGMLNVPADGKYNFAVAADDRGALYLDDKPIIFASGAPGDARFNADVDLTKGKHNFLFYQVNAGGPGLFSVGWRRDGVPNYEVLSKELFGVVPRGQIGTLEENKKPFAADFKVAVLGESFYADDTSYRLKFTAAPVKAATYTWDFGDGQTGSGADVEHVYFTSGVYPIQLTVKSPTAADTETSRVLADRDWDRSADPPTDNPALHSKIVAQYDISKLSAAASVRAVWLHLNAHEYDSLIVAMGQLASQKTHPDPAAALRALHEATHDCLGVGRIQSAIKAWDRVPPTSNIQPGAARLQALYLVWSMGEFDAAVKTLEPFAATNDTCRRTYAQALLLTGKVKEAKAILEKLPIQGSPERQVAISGAMARTVEFCITDGDWETGEDQWERWQAQYPTDFLEGYSVLLHVRLIELRKTPKVAAAVAIAYAEAMPNSSYSPQLLYEAATQLDKIDPAKSAELRATLAKRYPEDPLAQKK